MAHRIVWTLLAVIAVCAGPSAASAQGPGPANPGQVHPGIGPVGIPPGVDRFPSASPGLPNQDKRRDESSVWTGIPHVIPHGLPSGGSNPGRVIDPHTPKVIPLEASLAASEFKVPTTSVSPVLGEEASALARGISGKGGILAGIGGALAALFGGIFGRKKES
jgi:hypothetical protein